MAFRVFGVSVWHGGLRAVRETRFSDVCGTVDEFRSVLGKDKLEEDDVGVLRCLVDDALYMIGRMRSRLEEYEGVKEHLRALVEKMDEIESGRGLEASSLTNELKILVSGDLSKRNVKKAMALAENIRRVAGELEGILGSCKGRCLDLIDLYGRIKGMRDWSADEKKRIGLALPIIMSVDDLLKSVKEWLPPEPHRTKLIEFVKAGRAHIQPKQRKRPPIVYFEDGGTISLHKVRYSEEIRNFYPADRPSIRKD